MIIPAGKHNIDFRFEPKSYQLGAALTKYSSFIIVLILTFGIFYAIKSYRQGQKKAV
jgi:hypothetical protein